MIDTGFLLDVQALEKERAFRNKICRAINGIHSINGGRRTGDNFNTINIKIIWTECISNGSSNMRSLNIHTINHLDKTHVSSICKTSCIDYLEPKTWSDHLYTFDIFYCIKKR